METPSSNVKYHKLATEYSKIRAHANVLKRALLEEQNKSAGLRESLRQKDTSLRRFEQEVDSLGFRNKQLEHRVASLQDDLDRESKQKQTNKNSKITKNKSSAVDSTNNDIASDKLFVEEFQKKILENSQLVSLIADKNAENEMQCNRIAELEQQLSIIGVQRAESERNLRKEIENLLAKNSSLETKLSDEASIIGSDDALSVSESEHTPTHLLNSNDERITKLGLEIFHWKTKCELLEKCNALEISADNNTKTGATTITDNKPTKDAVLYNHFNKKLEDLYEQKCLAQSKAINMEAECESLQKNLKILQNKLSKNELKFVESQRNWQMSEEDLATTRINYEEQISVLTEQVISLSEQLAAMK